MKTILARLSRFWFVALVITATTVVAAPAPSMAAGDNYHYECAYSWASCQTGVVVGAPSGLPCKSASAGWGYTTVCVQYDGDYVYVKDRDADGNSAMGQIYSDSANGSITYRSCRNPNGVDSWVRCNFNWSESGTKYVQGGIRIDYDDLYTQALWSFSSN